MLRARLSPFQMLIHMAMLLQPAPRVHESRPQPVNLNCDLTTPATKLRPGVTEPTEAELEDAAEPKMEPGSDEAIEDALFRYSVSDTHSKEGGPVYETH